MSTSSKSHKPANDRTWGEIKATTWKWIKRFAIGIGIGLVFYPGTWLVAKYHYDNVVAAQKATNTSIPGMEYPTGLAVAVALVVASRVLFVLLRRQHTLDTINDNATTNFRRDQHVKGAEAKKLKKLPEWPKSLLIIYIVHLACWFVVILFLFA